MCGSLRGDCCVMWGWGLFMRVTGRGPHVWGLLSPIAVFPVMLLEGTVTRDSHQGPRLLWTCGRSDQHLLPTTRLVTPSHGAGISGKAAHVCVSKTNRRQVSALLSGVTREHESGSKGHMFSVPLMPGLWADSVWVWVGISKCSLG